MTELSPAAAEAFNAAWAADSTAAKVAAALRALANHQRELRCWLGGPIDHWRPDQHTRCELRNIADELESAP